MLYLDTSVIVAALVREVATDRVQSWFAAQGPDTLSISNWTETEFAAAVSMKLRMGQVTQQERATALAAFSTLVAETFSVLSVERRHFALAAQFALHPESVLRSGDALHLAIASGAGAKLGTLDHRLFKSASALGMQALLL